MVCPLRSPFVVAAAVRVGVLLVAASASLAAQDAESRIPVRVLGDRLVARCQLSSPTTSVPVNLWIDLERPCGLELHNKVADPLGIENPDGSTSPLTIELPGLDIEVERREHGDEVAMEEFTRRYAPMMEEIACAGTIGAKVLADYVVTVDLARSQIRLRPAVDRGGAEPGGPEAQYVPASVAGDAVWIAAALAGGQRRMLAIGSSRYDSVIDEDYCYEIDRPGGDVGLVEVAGVDLSQLVAWRPESYDLVHRDGALATLGIGFLRAFRIEVDSKNGWVGLTRIKELPFPAADAGFFAARATEEVGPLVEWLTEHHDSRLGGEAAALLLQMQIDEGAPSSEVGPALQWCHDALPADLRATEALATVDTLVQARRPDLAILAGRLGVESSRADRYPESVHRLHARLGELLLEGGDDRGAWEHLMSAAFGLTEAVGTADRAKVNLLLGRCYELRGKHKRAMSRYVQAVISPEFGPQAVAAIESLQQKLGGEPFSVDLVDKLISGKVRTMTAPTRFAVDASTDNNHCVLIEHFINPHLGQKRDEVWRAFTEGGSAVFEALQTHFPRERVALLSFHLDQPRPVALMNELSLREGERVGGRPMFAIDGNPIASGACRYSDADAVYQQVRDSVRDTLTRSSRFDIEVTADVENGVVRGHVEVRGPELRGRRIQVVLAERGVIYPGLGATVIHRMVARGALTEALDGVAWRPVNGVQGFAFERSLSAIEAANVAFLERYEADGGAPASRLSTRIAADQLSVVVIVREPQRGGVEQAAQIDVRVVGATGAAGAEGGR